MDHAYLRGVNDAEYYDALANLTNNYNDPVTINIGDKWHKTFRFTAL